MTDITSWNATDASNTSAPPAGWPENQAPSTVNDCARAMQGATRRFRDRIEPTLTTGGSANAQTLTWSGTAPAQATGNIYRAIAGFTNTSTVTLNPGDGGGARSVKLFGSALTGGEIIAGLEFAVYDDGTNLQLLDRPVYTAPRANLILNGGLSLDQQNEGASQNCNGNTLTYLSDGWLIPAGGSALSSPNVANQRVTDAPPGGTHSLKVTAAAGANNAATDLYNITHRIEADELHDLGFGVAGAQTLCLSFWAKSSVAGTYGVVLYNAARDRSYVTTYVLTANTWTWCFAIIPGDTTGTWALTGSGIGIEINWPLDAGSNFSVTSSLNQWLGSRQYGATGQTNLLNTIGATWQLSNVKLEISPQPTAYRADPLAQLIARAKRLYRKTFPAGTAPAQNAGLAGALGTTVASTTVGAFGAYWQFEPPMRATPTITTYNPAAAATSWRSSGGSNQTVSVDPETAIGPTGVMIIASTAGTVGNREYIHAVGDARL